MVEFAKMWISQGPRGPHGRDKIHKPNRKNHTHVCRQTAYSSWMKHTQLTWSSHNKITHTPRRPLRKETPSSCPLFIYSCRSPADIPPTLLRRPWNKLTGQGGGSLGRGEVVEVDAALTKLQNYVLETVSELHFCVNYLKQFTFTTKVHMSSVFVKWSACEEWQRET